MPKELISRFVKICPTCQSRRGVVQMTASHSQRAFPRLENITHLGRKAISHLPGENYSIRLPEVRERLEVIARQNCDKTRPNVSSYLPDLAHTCNLNSQSLPSLSMPHPLSSCDSSPFIQTPGSIDDTMTSLPGDNGYNASYVGPTNYYGC